MVTCVSTPPGRATSCPVSLGRLQLLRFRLCFPFLKPECSMIQVSSWFTVVALNKCRAHTILEIVRARWGTPAHIVFSFFCVLTNCE